MNRIFLIGNLGSAPELKHTQNGDAVCNFSVATSEKWTDKAGQKQESTEWHRCECWGKTAEICNTYLEKGSKVHVEGKISTKKVGEGDTAKYFTAVKVKEITFLGQRQGEGQKMRPEAPKKANNGKPQDFTANDIPF